MTGNSAGEVFAAAARWAAENDGRYWIETLNWKEASGVEHTLEMGIYYEPQT